MSRKAYISIAYIIFTVLFIWAINTFFYWSLDTVIYPILNWFIKQSLVLKLFFFFAVSPLLAFFLGIFTGYVHTGIIFLFFKDLPFTRAFSVYSALIFYINTFMCAREAYFNMPQWGFWYIVSFVMIIMICYAINYPLLYLYNAYNKYKKEMDELI